MSLISELSLARTDRGEKTKSKIGYNLIQKLMEWHNSGLSIYTGNLIARDDRTYQEALAQHIMRNAFGKNRKNFELLPAEKLIARVTGHQEKRIKIFRF